MDEHGKEKEILFENALVINNETGNSEICPNAFYIWADKDLLELIKNIVGVLDCSYYGGDTHYFVRIDARYNKEFVQKEIEAEILCKG